MPASTSSAAQSEGSIGIIASLCNKTSEVRVATRVATFLRVTQLLDTVSDAY